MNTPFFLVFGLMTFFSLVLLVGILYLILKPGEESPQATSPKRERNQGSTATAV